eukprot:c23123_g1_i2 orf=223-909(-)
MATEDVKVITVWQSPYGMRVEFALAAKGVPFERLPEDHWPNKSKLLIESNPVHKKIPVLLHNGKPVSESLIIVEYIDDAWPSPDGKDLLPHDPYDRAIARFWADYVENKLFGALKTILRTNDEVQKAGVEEAMSCVSTLEGILEKAPNGGPFFGGDHVGMVDVVLGPLFLWFPAFEIMGDFKFQIEDKFPRLHTWSQAMKTSSCAPCIPNQEKLTEAALVIRKRYVPT